jgi:hypothetical protein
MRFCVAMAILRPFADLDNCSLAQRVPTTRGEMERWHLAG